MCSMVSVIIPVYKAEKYLEKCVVSVLEQTYANIEVILVDDGSPDNSGLVCDEIARTDDRVKVIHKENGGVSSARNTGIDVANGEYITFVDSDDWLNRDSIEIMVSSITDNSVDLVAGGATFVTASGGRVRNPDRKVLNREEITKNITSLFVVIGDSVWSKLFKADIIKKNNLSFKNGMPFGEDSLFFWQYLQHINTIMTVNESVYNYNRIVDASAVTKFYDDFGIYMSCIYQEMVRLIDTSSANKEDKAEALSVISNHMCCKSINYIINNCYLNKAAKDKIAMIINNYADYLNSDLFNKSDIVYFSSDGFRLICEKNINKLIRLWRKDFRKSQPFIYIKHRVKKLLKKMRIV